MCVSSFAVTLILALVAGAAAQGQDLGIRHGRGRLPTIEEELQRHKIQLTKVALVDALRNPDPEVRSLAAAKLAQDKATETVPAILEALASEKAARTRVSIAFSLAQLGEPRGFSVLQDVCRDPSMPPWLRLEAARYMLDFLKREDETCRKALVEILQSQPDPDSLVEAVSLLRRFHDLSKEESETILQAALRALVAPEDRLRLAASRVLGDMGNSSAVPYLQRAVNREQDKTIRSQMQDDLQRLQRKQKQ